MNDAAPFFVMLSRPEARDPIALAKALAATRKTPLQDQMMAAKSSWGIVAEHLSEPDAQNLVQALRSFNMESIALPATSLAALPEAKSAATFALASAAQPVLIASAGVSVTTTTTKTVKEGPSAGQKMLSTAILLGTGLPIKIGGKERSVEKTQQHSDVEFYLELLYKDPWRRLRVEATKFDYSFLKERKLYQVLGNFKFLIGDLAKSYPGAWLNYGTRILLENKPVQTMGYGSLADLERESRWLLTLMSTQPHHGQI